jgi:hypothetical protein
MHVGSSDLNPVNWDLTEPACVKYWAQFPAQKKYSKNLKYRFSTPYCALVESPTVYESFIRLRRIPAFVYNGLAKYFGNKEMQLNGDRWVKIIKRSEFINNSFEHFMMNEWVFKTNAILEFNG